MLARRVCGFFSWCVLHGTYGLVELLVLGDAVAETSRVRVIIGLAGTCEGVTMRGEACCDEDGGDLE